MPVTETSEQITVVRALRKAGYLVWHTPNGGRRSRGEAVRLRQAGTLAGVPDLIIADRPPAHPDCTATALEMKTVKGRLRVEQRRVLDQLTRRGWLCLVGYGAQDAITKLKEAGYVL